MACLLIMSLLQRNPSGTRVCGESLTRGAGAGENQKRLADHTSDKELICIKLIQLSNKETTQFTDEYVRHGGPHLYSGTFKAKSKICLAYTSHPVSKNPHKKNVSYTKTCT